MAKEDGVVYSYTYNTDFKNKYGSANDITASGITIDAASPAIGAGSALGDGINDDGVIPFSSVLDVSNIGLAFAFKHTTAGTTIPMERSNGSPTTNGAWSVLTVGGKLQVFLRLGGAYQIVLSTTSINDGNWHLAFFSFNGSQLRLGIDNVLEATTNYSGSIPATGHDINKFARTGKIIPYPGNVDTDIMWNRAPTDGGVSIGQQMTGEAAEVWNSGNFIEIEAAAAFNPSWARNSNQIIGVKQ